MKKVIIPNKLILTKEEPIKHFSSVMMASWLGI